MYVFSQPPNYLSYVAAGSVHNVSEDRGRQSLTKEWRHKFLKRHPDLVFRKATRPNTARRTTTHDAVNEFYENLVKLVEEHNITAETLWNTDETGMFMHPGSGRVLARRGFPDIHKDTHGGKHDMATFICMTSAAGKFESPIIIFKGVKSILSCQHEVVFLTTGCWPGELSCMQLKLLRKGKRNRCENNKHSPKNELVS